MQMHPSRAPKPAVMAQVLVALGGNRHADRGSARGERSFKVPDAGLVGHPMVGGDEERGVWRRPRHLVHQSVQLCEMSLRLGSLRWPFMHGKVSGVDIEKPNFRLVPQYIERCR